MSTKVFEKMFWDDVTDFTAADVRNYNPNIFPTDADVPIHTYTSLKTLFVGTIVPVGDYRKLIVAKYGLSETNPDNSIEIVYLPEESVLAREGFQMDKPGAEFSKIMVLLRLKRNIAQADRDKLENCWLRIRHILDKDIRGIRVDYSNGQRLSPSIPKAVVQAADKTINYQLPYFVQFSGFVHTEHALEVGLIYDCNYVRWHPK